MKPTNIPLHARGVLQNLGDEKFEKLSFLTGILRGLLSKHAHVTKASRAGSIFMLPLYVCIVVSVGYYHEERVQQWHDSLGAFLMFCTMVVLGIIALVQLLEFPFRCTASHSIYRLAVVDAKGKRASISKLFVRWAIVWLPLFLPMVWVVLLVRRGEITSAFVAAPALLLLWIGVAVYAVIHPNRGLQDRLAGTWVVRH